MALLTSAQRKFLRGLANRLDPVILIGKGGVTEALLNAVDEALDAHELIKIRFNGFKDEKHELIDRIARQSQAEVAGRVGHVAILYRRHEDPEKRRIALPNPSGSIPAPKLPRTKKPPKP